MTAVDRRHHIETSMPQHGDLSLFFRPENICPLKKIICVHGSYTNNVVTCLQRRIQRGRWGRPPL